MVKQAKLLLVGPGHEIERALTASDMRDLFSVRHLLTLPELERLDPTNPPQVIVLDLKKLDALGLASIQHLARSWSEVPRLVVIDRLPDREVVAAIRAGATGCLFREDLEHRLIPAIHEAMEGGAPMSRAVARLVLERARRSSARMAAVRIEVPAAPQPLGPRRREVLELLALGRSYDEIAEALGMSLNTVRSHVREIYAMLGVSTKVEAVMAAIQRGLIKAPVPASNRPRAR